MDQRNRNITSVVNTQDSNVPYINFSISLQNHTYLHLPTNQPSLADERGFNAPRSLLQIFIKINVRQVCFYDGYTVVVLTQFLSVCQLPGIAVGGQLEDVTDIAAHRLHVLVDDDNLRITVLTQDVTEVSVGYREGASQDKYLVGSEHQLGCMVPCVYISFGNDGLQLQGRKERGDGKRLVVSIEADFCGKFIQEKVVLVLQIHIFHQRAVEIECGTAVLACVGRIVEVEGDEPALFVFKF